MPWARARSSCSERRRPRSAPPIAGRPRAACVFLAPPWALGLALLSLSLSLTRSNDLPWQACGGAIPLFHPLLIKPGRHLQLQPVDADSRDRRPGDLAAFVDIAPGHRLARLVCGGRYAGQVGSGSCKASGAMKGGEGKRGSLWHMQFGGEGVVGPAAPQRVIRKISRWFGWHRVVSSRGATDIKILSRCLRCL